MARPLAAAPAAPVAHESELLSTILQEVRALRDDVEALAARRLNAEERAQLTTLLPAAADVVGDAAFCVGDLFGLPQLAPLLAGHTAHTLPRLLVRAAGVTLGGFRVSRIGKDRDGTLFVTRSTRDRRTEAL